MSSIEQLIDTKTEVTNLSIIEHAPFGKNKKSLWNPEYINTVKVKDNELLPSLRTYFSGIFLQKNARNWFYSVENKINNLDVFEVIFRERF